MTRPEWCPADVWDLFGWFKQPPPQAVPPCPDWCPSDIWEAVDKTIINRDAFARTILAERERCVAVVESYLGTPKIEGENDIFTTIRTVVTTLIAAIRGA